MKFSVITINYNNRDGLEKTIQSVITQTFQDFEFIIIDGASTDGSRELLEQYSDKISYWVSEKDTGVYNAMNKGIMKSHGELLNFLNSGDCLYNEEVLSLVAAQTDDYDILIGKDYHYNEQTRQGFASILPPRVSMVTFYTETLPHQSAFFKRQLFSTNLYDESYRICADWAFYLQKVVKEGRHVRLIQEIIAQREQGGLSTTHTQLMANEHLRGLTALLPQGVMADYVTLSKLDKSTLYKLFSICEHPMAKKWLTIAIKILNRVFNCVSKYK